MSDDVTESSGVQKLIDRLHDQGVSKGRDEADELIASARRKSLEILDDAKRQSEAMLAEARSEAQRTKKGGEEAIRLAGRDAILELMEALGEDFSRKLHHLVQHELEDTSFLKQMILEITGKAVSAEGGKQIHLVFLGDTETENYDGESLDAFARGLAADAVRDGLTYSVSDSETPGIRVQFVGDDLEVDMTAETLTKLLVDHLSPKFREILETR